MGLTCRPLRVLHERDRRALIARILQVLVEEEVTAVVVGLPRPLSGGRNEQLEEAESFAAELSRATEVPVAAWDERFTTKLAERGRPGGQPADAVAACYLLQNYLDAGSSSGRRGVAAGGDDPAPGGAS